MNEKEIILEAMKKAGEPISAGKAAELTGLDKKAVDKAFAAMKKDGSIVLFELNNKPKKNGYIYNRLTDDAGNVVTV